MLTADIARWYCEDASHTHVSRTGDTHCADGRLFAERVMRMLDDKQLILVSVGR